MGWNPDRPPIEYLERRIRYYKKRIGTCNTTLKQEPSMGAINYFGSKKAFHSAVQGTIAKSMRRIKEFEIAIKILKKHSKLR